MATEQEFLQRLAELDVFVRDRFVDIPSEDGLQNAYYVNITNHIRSILNPPSFDMDGNLNVSIQASQSNSVSIENWDSVFLRDAGNSEEMAGNFSVAIPGRFFYRPDPTIDNFIERMILTIQDNAVSSPDDYGGISGGLTNGITLQVLDDSDTLIKDLLDTRTVRANLDWSRYCYDVINLGEGLTGNDAILVRWTFGRAGSPLFFPANSGYRIEMTIQDNLSALISHTAIIQKIGSPSS